MSYKDLLEKSTKELEELTLKLKAELFTLRYRNVTGDLRDTHKIKLLRTDIAKTLTALNAKKENK
ncbi:50S ribosomal protein L29 [Mycoplasma sp. CSL10137]|uniref:50S ribosomal protein L29 n=1 Tax=unclassified Mycoplasma TaxID=2683645 RepID=UPI001581E38E|nr:MULTISPECIES: 50S ribosomal protein L29 [unclassified Mycoplasma]MBN4083838.1 50S ribosomal protein L29 [Mycoplasma sp. CSL10137]MBN4084203.1 50S ribosomal protein L29 [Mycoplasma sp. CSL10166]MBU4692664.1 50S ribosomal protein L29 [Mycoplasma sp. CSL7491-lung]MCU4706867.1 50S ribosomal protein L29 [Mycoplasma sp. CSL7503-lung]QKT05608.1 50S ribosomal protein L29 [Mycoplasma sp. OR1901]